MRRLSTLSPTFRFFSRNTPAILSHTVRTTSSRWRPNNLFRLRPPNSCLNLTPLQTLFWKLNRLLAIYNRKLVCDGKDRTPEGETSGREEAAGSHTGLCGAQRQRPAPPPEASGGKGRPAGSTGAEPTCPSPTRVRRQRARRRRARGARGRRARRHRAKRARRAKRAQGHRERRTERAQGYRARRAKRAAASAAVPWLGAEGPGLPHRPPKGPAPSPGRPPAARPAPRPGSLAAPPPPGAPPAAPPFPRHAARSTAPGTRHFRPPPAAPGRVRRDAAGPEKGRGRERGGAGPGPGG